MGRREEMYPRPRRSGEEMSNLDDPRPWEMDCSKRIEPAVIYKYNNQEGAVLCRKCRVIVEEGLSHKEAVERYPEGALCGKCAGTSVLIGAKEMRNEEAKRL